MIGNRPALAGALLAALVMLPDATSAQCAMCRQALATPEASALAAALRSGIMLLLAAPFVVFGAVAMAVVRMQRQRAGIDGE